MFVHNITIKVEPSIEKSWVDWQKKENIPDMMRTGMFTENKFYRLLDQDETEGATYVLQFFSPSSGQFQEYQEKHAPLLQEKAQAKWGNHFVVFQTTMEVVH